MSTEESERSTQPLFTQLPAIGLLDGWRRNLTAFMCGVLATLAMPPVFLFPLLVPSFCGLIWLMNGAPSRKRVFWDGWWWGWGFYMTGLYWFCIALLTDAEKFAWLLPFALFGLTGVIAIYSGVACLLLTYIRVQGISRLFVFSVIWTLVEYARGHFFTGFPWNLPAYVLAVSDAALQPASVVGVYGVSWLVVFLAMLPSALGDFSISSHKALRALGIAFSVYALIFLWGIQRLGAADTNIYIPDIHLRLVQANISQHHKWEPARQMEGLKEHVRLTQQAGIEKITHVIWPETAVPYIVEPHSRLVEMLASALPEHALLVTGALRSGKQGSDLDIWNSILAIDPQAEITATYDKAKLVPFGEFLPLRAWIPPAWATPVGSKDFSRGKGLEVINLGELKTVQPLICYEAIFPELAFQQQSIRPAMLLNLTNDAWFGTSSGPYQHFHMSRMRAVEQGVPLIRVANTGISGVVDAYGRVEALLPLNEQGILDIQIPASKPASTLYSKIGDKFLLFLSAYAILLIIIRKNKRINNIDGG